MKSSNKIYRSDGTVEQRARGKGSQVPNHFGCEMEGKHFSISRTRYMLAIMQDTRKFISTAVLIAMVIVATRAVEAAFEATVEDWIPSSGPRYILWRWFVAAFACVAFVGVYFYVGIGNERSVFPEEFAEHDTYKCHSHSGNQGYKRDKASNQQRVLHDPQHPGSFHSFVPPNTHATHAFDGCL
jgi:hypothetical protein